MGVKAYKKACEFDSFGFGNRRANSKTSRCPSMIHRRCLTRFWPLILSWTLFICRSIKVTRKIKNKHRKCHEVARKHGKPILVMEPCMGDNLALVSKKRCSYEWISSGGICPLLGHPFRRKSGGCDDGAQRYDYHGATDRRYVLHGGLQALEQGRIQDPRAVHRYPQWKHSIPCTTCQYCEKNCPQNIAIPDNFALVNVGNDKKMLLCVVTQLMPYVGYPRNIEYTPMLKRIDSEVNRPQPLFPL